MGGILSATYSECAQPLGARVAARALRWVSVWTASSQQARLHQSGPGAGLHVPSAEGKLFTELEATTAQYCPPVRGRARLRVKSELRYSWRDGQRTER